MQKLFRIDVRIEDETVWMTQRGISELYQKGVNTINEHIKNIYNEQELSESSTIRKNRIVQTEGNRKVEREVSFYNLEMILAIGYRVRSNRGTQFRQWATESRGPSRAWQCDVYERLERKTGFILSV